MLKYCHSYENENIGDQEVPLKYRPYVKNWEPSPFPKINIDFCIDGRRYRISPSSLHGLWLFSIYGVNFPYKCEVELMDYVGPK